MVYKNKRAYHSLFPKGNELPTKKSPISLLRSGMTKPIFDMLYVLFAKFTTNPNVLNVKKRFIIPAVLFLILGVVVYFNYPKLNLISGYAAKNAASGVFIAGRSADSITTFDHDMPLISLAGSNVAPKGGFATASVKGLMQRKAVYKKGLGAVLVNEEHGQHAFNELPNRNRFAIHDSLPFPYGNNGVYDTLFPEVDYEQLDRAVAWAFENPEVQKTRSVLVAYKNELLAEAYADGFSSKTPILGWSMTKSVMATCYGILQNQKKWNWKDPAFPKALENGKPKGGINYDHLLRMQSGLAWEEDYFKISDVTKMLFLASDMSVAQENNEVIAEPTRIWNYSSGTSNLLSGRLRGFFPSLQDYLDFPYKAFIDKMGMYSMVLETDLVGNYVGSSYAWANTRDWAKFGLLYLNEGVWNGQRLLTPEWVYYVAEVTDGSAGTYGAHFWLNAEGKYPDVPKDLFSANGFQGQYVFIIPSKDLVVVRTGLAEHPDFDVNAFLSGIIDALP